MRARLATIVVGGVLFVLLTGCVRELPRELTVPDRVLSVCELSRDFSAYARQTIMVRGVYFNGLRQECHGSCPSGQPWPSVLDLAESHYAESDGLRVPFVTNSSSWDVLGEAELRTARSGERAEIWVTVRGYLIAWKTPLGPCDYVAGQRQGGLSTAGPFGGRLIVESVRDVKTVKKANGYDYSFVLRPSHAR